MAKKLFRELVQTSSFERAFKNMIRDYYAYGYKSYKQYSTSDQNLRNRWRLFSIILNEKWDLTEDGHGGNRITLKTMEHETDNPVDDLFFLHNIPNVGSCLNYLFDMDTESMFRGRVEDLPVSEDELCTVEGKSGKQNLVDVNEVEYMIIQNWLKELDSVSGQDSSGEYPVRMNRQLNIWSPYTRISPATSYKYKYKNLSTKTERMKAFGIIANLKETINERNTWLKKQWDKYCMAESLGKGNSIGRRFEDNTSGRSYWFKSDLTMEKLTDYGQSIYEDQDTECGAPGDFRNDFYTMCAFFSQYYPLGEIGTILKKRVRNFICSETRSIFRFQHNYYQKSLYDYNLIDLWLAIEGQYFCKVGYSHGINKTYFEELIIPLEIRVSLSNGREYVMYYNVFDRKIKALRLEFIEKIQLFTKIKTVQKTVYEIRYETNKEKDSKKEKVIKKEISTEKNLIIEEDISKQLDFARQMMPYIWGAEVTDCLVDAFWRERVRTYHLKLSCNPSKEQYIQERIHKEKRKGKQETGREDVISISCFPTKEFRNWIRSFYVRVEDASAFCDNSFSVRDDVQKMWSMYHDRRGIKNDIDPNDFAGENESQYQTEYTIKGREICPEEGHESLFNEFFSIYTITLANVLLKCSGQKPNDVSSYRGWILQNLEAEARKNLRHYHNEEDIQDSVNHLFDYAVDNELVGHYGKTRFVSTRKDYLYDFLPLTRVEIRWLLMVLEDPISGIFLPDNVRKLLCSWLKNSVPFRVTSFPIDKINYFDRYNVSSAEEKKKDRINKEIRHLQTIQRAMVRGKRITVTHRTWNGEKRRITCKPSWIEYSRRDDVFRMWYFHNRINKVMKVNIPRIIDIQVQENQNYNLQSEQKKIRTAVNRTERTIVLEFNKGKKNLPDRILTEFSLWKKTCSYDRNTDIFTMTLKYPEMDEKEILIRILGYGPYVKVVSDQGGYILDEIVKRLDVQRDLTINREYEG